MTMFLCIIVKEFLLSKNLARKHISISYFWHLTSLIFKFYCGYQNWYASIHSLWCCSFNAIFERFQILWGKSLSEFLQSLNTYIISYKFMQIHTYNLIIHLRKKIDGCHFPRKSHSWCFFPWLWGPSFCLAS